MTTDISISCATLSNGYDAPVIAIGACVFDITTGKLGDKFYREIAVSWALRLGKPEASKIAWWMQQTPKARKIFETDDNEKSSNSTVLLDFTKWVFNAGGPLRVWTGGASRDTTWIERALAEGSHGISCPWKHHQVCDYRTIIEMAKVMNGFDDASITHEGVLGHAGDDASDQARVIAAAYASYQKGLVNLPEKLMKTAAAVRATNAKPASNVDDL